MTHISETNAFLYTGLTALISTFLMVLLIDLDLIVAIIYSHVGLGSLAFVIGGIPLVAKKGSPLHQQTGKIFYYSMVVSVALSLVVSLLPGHVSPTMFHIAVLSLYFLLGGKRSVLFKQPEHHYTVDKVLALTVILTSVAVMTYSVIVEGRVHPLRTVFGTIGIVFGVLDLWLFQAPQQARKKWLFLHLSKMLGGYTAAVTAFFVAQNILFGYFNWFAPTVVGVSYIVYWTVKMKTFRPVQPQS